MLTNEILGEHSHRADDLLDFPYFLSLNKQRKLNPEKKNNLNATFNWFRV